MDNQKPNTGNGSNLSAEGAGSSMGKDQGSNRSGANGNNSNTGNTGSAAEKFSNTAKELADDAVKSASDAHKTIDKAAEAAQPVVDRLASQAHAGVDKVSGALTGASDKLTNALSGATGKFDDKKRQLVDAYGNFSETGREYVRTSPGTSVLIAVAAGFVLSKLLGSRR